MPKTVVFRDNSHLDNLVLGNVNYYGASGEAQKTASSKEEHPERKIEDVEFEEINTYCRYLDIEEIKRKGIRTPAEVQEQLEKKSKEDGKTFAIFLREQIGLGYINFHGDKIAEVFANLHTDLPMMRDYTINNFYTYFRDVPL